MEATIRGSAEERPPASMLEMRGITKRFPGVVANDRVDFEVRAGEVHSLLGENGAGKSTLMRILYGLYRADEGEIRLKGEPVAITSPSDAIARGIGMIHQHFMLVPTLTVAENVALGLPSPRRPLTDLEAASGRILELSRTYGLKVDPKAYVWQLSVGERQRVEIIKALYRNASLLILDEPTAVLTPQEVDDLFAIFRQMVADGRGLVFISHKIREVRALSDRITVLRNGRVVGTVLPADVSGRDLAHMMVGRDVGMVQRPSAGPAGEARLVVRSLTVAGDRGTEAVRGLDLEVRSGVIGDFTVADNLMLVDSRTRSYTKWGLLRNRLIRRHCRELVDAFNVKTPGLDTPTRNLSGGNIQKLILARELSGKPRVLLVAQPTRGVDVGAAEYIHRRLLEQRE